MIKIAPPRSNDKIHLDQAWYRLIEAITTTVEPNSVATLAALAALDDVPDGNGRVVRSLKAIWMRNASSVAVADGITVIVSADGGRWIRQAQIDPTWASQATWYVNSVTGSDENDGSTSDTALQTLSEFSRRVNDMTLQQSTTVWIEVDCLATDIVDLRPHTVAGNTFTIQGIPALQLETTVVDFTKDYATNNPGTLQLSGWTVATHIGQLIEFVDGPAAGGFTWVSYDAGLGNALVGAIMTGSTVKPNPVLGNIARIHTLPKVYINHLSIDPKNGFGCTLASLHVIGRTTSYGSTLNASQVISTTCVLYKVDSMGNMVAYNCSGFVTSFGILTVYGGCYRYISLLDSRTSISAAVLLFSSSIPAGTTASGLLIGSAATCNVFVGLCLHGTFTRCVDVSSSGTLNISGVLSGVAAGIGIRVDKNGTVLLDTTQTTLATTAENIRLLALTVNNQRTWAQVPCSDYHSDTQVLTTNQAVLTGGIQDSVAVGIQGALTADATRYALQNLSNSATPLPKIAIQNAVLGNLYVNLGTAPSNTSTVTVNILLNGNPTALTCQVAAGATTAFDTTVAHRTLVAPGDRVDVQVVTVTGGAFAATDLSVNLEMA